MWTRTPNGSFVAYNNCSAINVPVCCRSCTIKFQCPKHPLLNVLCKNELSGRKRATVLTAWGLSFAAFFYSNVRGRQAGSAGKSWRLLFYGVSIFSHMAGGSGERVWSRPRFHLGVWGLAIVVHLTPMSQIKVWSWARQKHEACHVCSCVSNVVPAGRRYSSTDQSCCF